MERNVRSRRDCRERWVDGFGDVKNELVRGETGWSSFKEREAKVKIKWFVRLLFGENVVSEIGRVCLHEVGLKSRWWERVKHLCEKAELFELLNVICLGDCSVKGPRVLDVHDLKKFCIRELRRK